MLRKTKIIATLGPKSSNSNMIKNLISAGVNVFRVNLSHGDKFTHEKTINMVKSVREKLKKSVAIMVDTRGPEVRVKTFKDGKVKLKTGSDFCFVKDDIIGDETKVSVTLPSCLDELKVKDVVLLNDGLIKLRVKEVLKDKVVTKVVSGGELSNNKGLSFVSKSIKQEYLNEKDVEDLKYLLPLGIDYISASFVSKKEDVNSLSKFVSNIDNEVKIIAKIENYEGIKNLNDILSATDGIMVARGDLGVELPFEDLPKIQKNMIEKTTSCGKICIVATEMLESMIVKTRPTRAEISDVANAVYDGASAVMLSAETAVGIDPVNCVKTMSKIIISAENDIDYKQKFLQQKQNPTNFYDLLGQSAINASFNLKIKAIVIYTNTGKSVGNFCKFKSKVPIIAITDNQKTFNQLAMYNNCYSTYCKFKTDIFAQAKVMALNTNIVKPNDNIIVITGSSDKISYCLKIETLN